MRNLIFLFLLSQSHGAWAQLRVNVDWQDNRYGGGGDSLYYDMSRKLVWDDFEGRPENRSIAAAVTSSGFGYTQKLHVVDGKGTLTIRVSCFFLRPKSWVKPGMDVDYTLTHEQHHFDITYLATHVFIQKLRSANITIDNCNELVERIYDESFREMQEHQDEYDGQTHNGQLKNIQMAWNRRIEGQLADLVINSQPVRESSDHGEQYSRFRRR
jgi:hypothetical protein